MKKFYAILAASLVAGSAMAATPKADRVQMEAFNPEMASVVEQAHADLLSGKTGETFVMKMKAPESEQFLVRSTKNKKRFIDLISASMTFEQAPYYWYTISFEDEEGSIAVYDYIIPCIAYLKASMEEDSPLFDDEDNFNWDLAAQEYGSLEAAQASPTFAEICQYMNGYYIPEYPYGKLGAYVAWCYNPSTWQTKKGYYLRPGVISGNEVDYTNAAKLYLVSYDEETGDFEGGFYAPMGTMNSTQDGFGTLVGTMQAEELTASPLMLGWGGVANMEVGEVHIFNLGATSGDYELSDGYNVEDIYEEYEPAQMYYLAFCTPQLSFESKIEEAKLPIAPAIVDSSYTIDQVNWFSGHFTLAENATPEVTYPEGLATLSGYTVDNLGYVADTFGPGIAFSAYYLKACEDSKILANLGFLGQFYGEQCIPYYDRTSAGVLTEATKFSFGNKTMGFNGYVYGDNGAVVEFKYTGDINYHYDPTDYRTSKKISAIGNSDESAAGVKNITTVNDAETVATEYYNFQGIRMNGAPEKGMYIVREYKADGTVVSSKVAK